MSGFFSFTVFSPTEFDLDNYLTVARGSNTFNVHVRDLDAFLSVLQAEGVRVDKVCKLDETPAATPTPLYALPFDAPALPLP